MTVPIFNMKVQLHGMQVNKTKRAHAKSGPATSINSSTLLIMLPTPKPNTAQSPALRRFPCLAQCELLCTDDVYATHDINTTNDRKSKVMDEKRPSMQICNIPWRCDRE